MEELGAASYGDCSGCMEGVQDVVINCSEVHLVFRLCKNDWENHGLVSVFL